MTSSTSTIVPVEIDAQHDRALIAIGDADKYVVPGLFDFTFTGKGNNARGIAPVDLMDLLGRPICNRVMRGQLNEDCGQPTGPLTTSVDKEQGDKILELLEEHCDLI